MIMIQRMCDVNCSSANNSLRLSSLSVPTLAVHVTPGRRRLPRAVSVCVAILAGALVTRVFINTVLVAIRIIHAFIDICTPLHHTCIHCCLHIYIYICITYWHSLISAPRSIILAFNDICTSLRHTGID